VLELRDVPPDPDRTAVAITRGVERRVATRFVTAQEARAHAERAVERTAETSTWVDVVEGPDVVGWLWLVADTEELLVHDAVLDAPDRASELLVPLVERARVSHARMLGVAVTLDDPTLAAFAGLPGMRVRATNMVLSLEAEISDPDPVALHPMTDQEFEVWVEGEVEGYADEIAATGLSPERALERSRTQMAELLPEGRQSPGMEFFLARVGDEVVGDLWLETGETMAFVYNVEVLAEQRRRGYGAAIMNAGARHCRDTGHPYLGLNVFGHNPNARSLYDKLGYRVTVDYSALDVADAG